MQTEANSYRQTDNESVTAVQHSLGSGLEVLLKIESATYQAISFELNYNNLDIGKALAKIDFNRCAFHTNRTFGMRIKYCFGFASNEK